MAWRKDNDFTKEQQEGDRLFFCLPFWYKERMPRKKPLRLLLGLRLRDPGSPGACRAALAALAEAESLDSPLPLHWNLPLAPLAAAGSRAAAELGTRIKARVKTQADTVLLAGFRGAPHLLLQAEELDREIAWCRRNPWLPGAKSLLGQEPAHLLPLSPDLLREQACGLYSRRGFVSVGVALPLEQALRLLFARRGCYRFLLAQEPGRAAVYSCLLPPSGIDPARLAGLPDGLEVGQQPLFLLLELGAEAAGPRLTPLVQALAARYELEPLSLSRDPVFPAGNESGQPPYDPAALLSAFDPLELNSPQVLEGTARAAALRGRRRRRSDADLRAVLDATAGAPRSAARNRERARPSAEQVLIASMAGLVSLDGPRFAATFDDGRFTGLRQDGTQVLAGLPARSYLVVKGKTQELQTESAFSFEREPESGLRSVLKTRLPGTDGDIRLQVDAYFRDQELELDFALSFPVFPPGTMLEQLAPFELVLFVLGRQEQVQVSSELGDGLAHRQTLAAEPACRLLYGTRFLLSSLPARGLALTLAAGGIGASPLVLPLRVQRERGRRLLLANPFGSYSPAPAAAFSGRTESFSLRIGLQ